MLEVDITAIHGSPGPHTDWMISSTPGMADSTKLYHDAVAPMHTTVVADHGEVVFLHAEIMAAAQALAESGLDAYAFIRRDGTVPLRRCRSACIRRRMRTMRTCRRRRGSRARIIEYVNQAVKKTGDMMTGPLSIAAGANAGHARCQQEVCR